MKLEAQIGETTTSIELDHGAGTFRVSLDGRIVEGEVREPEPGVFAFKVCDRIVEFHASTLHGLDLRRVVTGTGTTDVRIIDRKHRSASDDAEGDGQQTLLAPMPGRVVAVLADVGDEIKKGQGLLVVEAMKMQNEVKAVRDGIVTEIRVATGDTVSAGQVLARLE